MSSIGYIMVSTWTTCLTCTRLRNIDKECVHSLKILMRLLEWAEQNWNLNRILSLLLSDFLWRNCNIIKDYKCSYQVLLTICLQSWRFEEGWGTSTCVSSKQIDEEPAASVWWHFVTASNSSLRSRSTDRNAEKKNNRFIFNELKTCLES